MVNASEKKTDYTKTATNYTKCKIRHTKILFGTACN